VRNLNNINPIPKTAFGFEDTMVSLNASIHNVVVEISTKQLSENHRHLMATLSFKGLFLRLITYDWGCISSSNCKMAETVTEGRRASEEDRIGNLIIYEHDERWN